MTKCPANKEKSEKGPDPILNFPAGEKAIDVINNLSISEENDRRNGADTKVCAQVTVLLNVNPVNFYLRKGFADPLHEAAKDLYTSSPFCKENSDDKVIFATV